MNRPADPNGCRSAGPAAHVPAHLAGARPVAVTDRSGFDESIHFGLVVVLDADGSVRVSVGDPEAPVYPRSANKPLQTDAMLRCGLDLPPEGVALSCASHSGTDAHLDVVRSTLEGAGLALDELGNTDGLPLDRAAAHAWLRADGRPDPMHMNCSGKHAAMLATCVSNGWPTAGYLEVDHPLQRAITARIDELAGGVGHIGVDGCGAPAHVLTMRGLAAAFATVASEGGAVWSAMTSHPELVGGAGRDVTRLMRAVPGLMAKDGAEGVFAAALPDGRAAAVKIADGNARAAGVVLAAALARVGVDVDLDADPPVVGDPILGHGEPVGRVRPVLDGATKVG